MADGLVVCQQRRYLAGEGCIRLRKVLEHVFVDAGFGELERGGSLPDGRPVAEHIARLGNAALGDGFVHVRNLLLRFCMVAQKALQEDMSRKRP